ncbi:hypothetical protein F0U44_08930 [Nocardioides humilatus]|uniref:Uncharacterized protein n=1 Tax=Nocardioides humilatus TaxID=2607660 RepID=A0A5B1LCZ8_9ACTN|nr:hypothetical protein [Nocardioides humilatus]KAA1418613.1 hypothetical protein F0U44_08930 [Nocardioides humilatus]
MNKLTRTAVGALAVAAVIAPVSASATSARPAGAAKHWTTIETALMAKQQACKVSANDGTAWKIFNRLDARRVDRGRVASYLTAVRNGEEVPSRSWSSGWVQHGHLSDVGTFRVPKNGPWTLTMALYGDDAGTGGELTAADIGRC